MPLACCSPQKESVKPKRKSLWATRVFTGTSPSAAGAARPLLAAAQHLHLAVTPLLGHQHAVHDDLVV
jgi:hypothetical protein